jgi:hypothetical protein
MEPLRKAAKILAILAAGIVGVAAGFPAGLVRWEIHRVS